MTRYRPRIGIYRPLTRLRPTAGDRLRTSGQGAELVYGLCFLEVTISDETVCDSAAETSTVARASYGPIRRRTVRERDGTALTARGEQRAPRTSRGATIRRLEGGETAFTNAIVGSGTESLRRYSCA